jgi:DNA-binding NarL/FixJ family response regulator
MARAARILIADDHELVRQGMRAIIQSEPGWVVCGEAITGRQAVEKAIELAPDVLIVDLALPELNGMEVTRKVRSESEVPVLIVTMHNSDHLVEEAIKAGASGYLLKADAGRTLVEAVRTILSRGEFFSQRVRVAAASRRTAAGRPQSGPLTTREREVLQLLAEGRGNKEIGATLGISSKTAETHRARIMAKLELHSISELVRYAVRNHIIEP